MASRAPQHALDLFQAGYAPTVVFSAGTLKDAPRPSFPWRPFVGGLSEADGWAFRPSPPSSPLSEAQSTYDEARGLRVLNLRTMAQEHEWQTLILVTDAFHTRRAACTFRALCLASLFVGGLSEANSASETPPTTPASTGPTTASGRSERR